ncbi:MAG: HAMP domain-containing protein [Actinobacteria bacterium]|nr:HAMP domain-containing protein [Actinomycetota bacterium]
MSFHSRLILVTATAVAIAVSAAAAVTFAIVRDQLLGSVDDSLRDRAGSMFRPRILPDRGGDRFLGPGPPGFPGAAPYVQLVTSTGEVIRSRGSQSVALPVTGRTTATARGGDGYFTDARVDGVRVRILTAPARDRRTGETYAVQIARPLGEVDASLARIRRWLIVVAAGGIAIAIALGLLVARTALAPVRRLTAAAEEVTRTHDLSRRIEVGRGRDELSRLAATFNEMLGALEESARAQRRLVADASHELRTPLTSLRTNIEVLARGRELPPGERESLLRDVTDQLEEMTALIAELVELARGDREVAEPADVRLDLVTADAIERTRRNRPGVEIRADLAESVVHGVGPSLERAISNLLDNAAKWSPPGGAIDVSVRGGEVVVRDRGPGIDEADLPFVFDRFYRAASARGLPGSGLGLAIVRQVAEAHGGAVAVERPEGGGTLVRLRVGSGAPSSKGQGAAAFRNIP